MKLADLNPRPKMSEDRLCRGECAARLKGEIESDNRRDTYGPTGNEADKLFASETATEEPVDGRSGKRREDDQAQKFVIHSTLYWGPPAPSPAMLGLDSNPRSECRT